MPSTDLLLGDYAYYAGIDPGKNGAIGLMSSSGTAIWRGLPAVSAARRRASVLRTLMGRARRGRRRTIEGASVTAIVVSCNWWFRLLRAAGLR